MSTASFFKDKSVLITGASSGIGEELALQAAAFGAKLTLAARRRDALESLAEKIAAAGHSKPLVTECDVARDGDLERAVAAAVRQWGKLDVAIANAGFGVGGPLKRLSVDDYKRQFETNVYGVLRTIFAALPEVEKTRGNLAIVGSVAGWVASSGNSPYSMSKFALRALANSITPELRRAGVKVTLISPGFVVSNIRRVDNYGKYHSEARESVPAWVMMSTQKCARQALAAIARGKHEKIITFHGKVLVGIARFAPWILRELTKRFSRSSQQ